MKIENNMKRLNKDYNIRVLDKNDEEALQELCESCIEYYEIVEGRFPEKDAAHEILTELPPGRDIEDKIVLGCFNNDDILVAVMDILRDYPDKGEWIIGLLMVGPTVRRVGLGKALHEFIKEFVKLHGGVKLRIGVVLGNQKAERFWSSLGYSEVKRVNMKNGNKDNIVIVMNLLLS